MSTCPLCYSNLLLPAETFSHRSERNTATNSHPAPPCSACPATEGCPPQLPRCDPRKGLPCPESVPIARTGPAPHPPTPVALPQASQSPGMGRSLWQAAPTAFCCPHRCADSTMEAQVPQSRLALPTCATATGCTNRPDHIAAGLLLAQPAETRSNCPFSLPSRPGNAAHCQETAGLW